MTLPGRHALVVVALTFWSIAGSNNPKLVVVKEVYSGTDCNPAQVERWVAMRKEKRFDAPYSDWHWQEVKSDGHVASDGATQACIDCHRGGDAANCIGYGEQNGRDYTCTVPDVTRDAGR